MARAILEALIDSKITAPEKITVSDISTARLEDIKNKYRVCTTSSNTRAIAAADIIILAVKPQNLDAISRELVGKFSPGKLVISILAGTNLESLANSLKHGEVIRAMPNTPAQIRMGMTAWTASPAVTEEKKKAAQSILSTMGKAIFFEDEAFIDMSTAISGSGPAYFYLFMESLVEAGVELGLPRETAIELVMQTALGSVSYALKSDAGLTTLRQQVTSPGGTTEAALKIFESEGLKDIIIKAVAGAHGRAREIGKC